MLDSILNQILQKRISDNIFRRLSTTQASIDFTSNDYLGLARSEELFILIEKKIKSLPHLNGATGSRLLSGNSLYTEQVEIYLSKIFQAQATLIFNSGYAANQAVLSSIPQKNDTILYDELVHACMRDGARLSPASRFPFRHNNLNDLEEKLKKATGTIYIAVESIYSMDGDVCPLVDLISLADKYNAIIILDEAHSTGVMGKNGSGLASSLGVEGKIPIRIFTFGKAMGVHGACVAGSQTLIDFLINYGRTFIFTTGLPLHSIASIECAFQYLSLNINLQEILKERVTYFIRQSQNTSLNKLQSPSQIQGFIFPGNEKIKKIASQLQHQGFDIRPIVAPTVQKGSERLRICLHTYNSNEVIDRLIKALSSL